MRCIISGGNIKTLAKAVQMLAKIGDEVCVQPQEDSLSFRTVNGSNSAFGDVTFQQDFFSYFAFEPQESCDYLKCKIHLRGPMAIFKTANILEKQVETCEILLAANADTLCLIIKYKNGISKTHLLSIIDDEVVKANYKKDGTRNHLKVQPRVMTDVIQNFQQNLLEITIEIQKEKVLIRNYIDDTSCVANETRTQLVFGVPEFDEYTIDSEMAITFCLKEFRAMTVFSEALSHPIDVYFDRPGRPCVFVCKTLNVEANLVLSTLNPTTDGSSQSTASMQPKTMPKKAPAKRAPVKKGLKSFVKKTFSSTFNSKASNHSANVNDLESTGSPGRISDIDSPLCNAKKSASSNSPKPRTLEGYMNSSLHLRENENPIQKSPLSSLLKRKSDQDIQVDPGNDSDFVRNSPPTHCSKKAKLIFKKCFSTTLDPRLPESNDVEVEDSGDEN
ncbi:hypothetical protein QAD02_015672 [Eretmocerus hayati]|uniref:Uncharacterized protein n=1 Tax=Eretmocerus hayati TaxID=131215 RepID=A0ACC2P8G5_9HYME|nr:hypothetical protein QAD02_015672 [Eretmocerus hayati]